MNTGQQVILVVGLAVITVMGIFPPWLYIVDEHYDRNSLHAEVPAGFHFIFSPPPLRIDRDHFPEMSGLLYLELRGSGYPRLDYSRLLIQWLGVVIVVGGSVYILRFYSQANRGKRYNREKTVGHGKSVPQNDGQNTADRFALSTKSPAPLSSVTANSRRPWTRWLRTSGRK